jgi:chemotaxis protein MotC
MKGRYPMVIIAVILCSPVIVCSSSAAVSARPAQDVRTLVAVQNRLVFGHVSALNAQRVLIRDIARRFAAMPADRWSEVANARAAIRYLLSGGDPAFARPDQMRSALPEQYRRLLVAAVAYADGSVERARNAFSEIEIANLPPDLAAPVSLVKGVLMASTQPDHAWRYLDIARLEGMGTLIEEAALRRQMGLFSAKSHHPWYRSIARTYIRSYQESVFADGFQHSFALAIGRYAGQDGADLTQWLLPTLELVRAVRRPEYVAPIARQALMLGRPKVMERLGDLLHEDIAASASRTSYQMTLYRAAAQIVSVDATAVEKRLVAMDTSGLPAFDRAIHLSALELARQVRAPAEAEAAERQTTQTAAAPSDRQLPGEGTIAAGTAALERVAAILTKKSPVLRQPSEPK